MTGIVKKISFFILFLFVITIAAAVAWWGVVQRAWPLWVGVAMAAGILGLFLFILFLKKYLIRRREKKLVENIVEQGQIVDEEAIPEQLHIKELEKNWAANIALLRGSHLRKKGNPLYVLPWYLTLGSSESGKTTALGNSGLSTPFTEVERKEGIPATRNCDWWFLDDAVILDTAGRYAVPAEGAVEQNEWKRFLTLLVKHRKREPLNGILLFVAADSLLDVSAEILRKQGQVLRNRINNLMRTVGYKIPVRLLVTKMDRVPGFSGFADSIDPADREQVMGYWNRKGNPYWQEVVDEVMRETGDRLRSLRFKSLFSGQRTEPGFLIFPISFEGLHTGLNNFLEPIFSENQFQETPYLAGVYFSSGHCQASPLPASFGAGSKGVQPDRGASFFLKDFFSRILADGRSQLEPVKEYAVWRRVTRNLGLMSWLLFCLFLAGLTALSFQHNQETIAHAVIVEVPDGETGVRNANSGILKLEKMRMNIQELEELNKSWHLPRLGLKHSLRAEKELKEKYCSLFSSTVQQPMEKGLARMINEVDTDTPDHLFADYAAYIIEQITLLKEYLSGHVSSSRPGYTPVASRILNFENPGTFTEVAAFFTDLNTSYLLWSDDRAGASSRLKNLRAHLDGLLANRIDEPSWLYSLVISKTEPIRLSDFWHHALPSELEMITVPGAFTIAGRKEIKTFLKKAEDVGEDEMVKELLTSFQHAYPAHFFESWHAFAEDFQAGRTSLRGGMEWREPAIRMTTNANPYFGLIEVMATELKQFAREREVAVPAWGQAVIGFDEVWKLAIASRKAEEKKISAISSKVKVAKKKFLEKSIAKVGAGQGKQLATQLHLAKAWDEYEKALAGLDEATPYREKTFQKLTAWFGDVVNPEEKDASLYGAAYQASSTLKGLATGRYDNALAWRLVNGPFEFLIEFAVRESAAMLQKRWMEQVVAQAESVDSDKMLGLLFDENEGVVWKYVKGTANPFLVKTVHGYRPREAFGQHLNFVSSFYTFLDRGAALVINRQDEYRVTIDTRPIEVNNDATEEPYAATITMQCAEDRIVLENDNYPRSQTFTWSPDKCGDVTLTIQFPVVTLSRSYRGSMAFAYFLDSFVDGRLSFIPDDFPEHAGHLRATNVKEIVLTYSVTGQEPVLRLLNQRPVVPGVIIEPEQQGEAY